MVDVFKPTNTRKIPKSDPQVIRIDMTKADIGGRKSHLPNESKSDKMSITHVSGEGNKD